MNYRAKCILRTDCGYCGKYSIRWSLLIVTEPHNRTRQIDEGAIYNNCQHCGSEMNRDIEQHQRKIAEKIDELSKPEGTDADKIIDQLLLTTVEFNQEMAKQVELRKPDGEGSNMASFKQHKRYRINGFNGIECSNCKNIINIPNDPDKICPVCATEIKRNETLITL